MKMIVVNLLASPGSGKSTTAAYVFSKLKMEGYNVEYVGEFAKDVTYEGRTHLLHNQVYIFAKQYKRLKDIQNYGKVPLVITDSPLALSHYYGNHLPYSKVLSGLVNCLQSEFENYNVLISRAKAYNPSGRNQTEKESDKIAQWIKDFLPYDININGNEAGADQLVEICKSLLKLKE